MGSKCVGNRDDAHDPAGLSFDSRCAALLVIVLHILESTYACTYHKCNTPYLRVLRTNR